jgi:7-cyano-7-deazaguanine synthase in queuosine biosynthesis
MTNEEIEIELRHLATKEALTKLELAVSDRIVASERALRNSIDNTRNLIFGTYALMIAAIFINHFWR